MKQIFFKTLSLLVVFTCLIQFKSYSQINFPPIKGGERGTIGTFNPLPPDPGVELGKTGPYIDGKDHSYKIVNICKDSTITIQAHTGTSPLLTNYQWYASVATYNKLTRKISWSSWSAIQGATKNTFDIKFRDLFALNTTYHVVFYCKITKSGKGGITSYTNMIAFSKAVTPTVEPLQVEVSYACPGQNATIIPIYSATGDNTSVYWERRENSKPTIWTALDVEVDPFLFPADSYRDGTYDYRLAIENNCVNFKSETLNEMGLTIAPAYNESFAPIVPESKNKTVCINSQTDFTFTINGYNNFHQYVHTWEFQYDGETTWNTITSANAGKEFQDYNTASLKVTPTRENFHNMKFRLTTVGACKTITSEVRKLLLQVPAELSGIRVDSDIVCEGEHIILTALPADNPLSAPIEYRWKTDNNSIIGQAFSPDNNEFSYTMGHSAKTFTCEVQNGDKCIGKINSYSIPINVHQVPSISLVPTISGCGGSLANISIYGTGGKSPYTYQWTLPDKTIIDEQTIENVPTNNTYIARIEDACQNAKIDSITVNSLPILHVESSHEHVKCENQANGKISTSISGGVAPYNIVILKHDFLLGFTKYISVSNYSSAIFTIDTLHAGDYKIEITDACDSLKTLDITILQPKELTAFISSYKHVSCHNGGDGEATVHVQGGTQPYIVNWITGQKTQSVKGLFAGHYVVNVSDNNGCFASTYIDIQEPQEFSIKVTTKNAQCYATPTGSITINPQGGTKPYSIILKNAQGNTVPPESYNSLYAGTYIVEAKDSCGAIITETIQIEQAKKLEYTVLATDISCNGFNNGSIFIEVHSSVNHHSIVWNTGDSIFTLAPLTKGMYIYTLTDACDIITDTVEISEPSELQAELEVTNISCSGLIDGHITAYILGGTQPYEYTWNNGKKTQSISNLPEGKYSVHVQDSRGCSLMQSATITEPQLLQVDILSTHISCFGAATGSIEAVASHGVEPYQFLWQDSSTLPAIDSLEAGTYSVTVTDNCNTSIEKTVTLLQPTQFTYNIEQEHVSCHGLSDGYIHITPIAGTPPYSIEWLGEFEGFEQKKVAAGTYTFIIADACTEPDTVTIEITEPNPFDIDITISHVTCYGLGNGLATATASGGIEPYTYRWSIGQSGNTAQGLFPGLYSINAYDAQGCFASQVFAIEQPLPLEATLTVTNTTCGEESGSIYTTVTGGTAPYTFLWSDNSTEAEITQLSEGYYSIAITDSHNCTIRKEASIQSEAPVYPICIVTIDAEIGTNKVVWEKIWNSAIEKVHIYKMSGGEYAWIGSIDSIRQSYFDDRITNPLQSPSRYAIRTEDACGNMSKFSAFHQTIHVGAALGSDGVSNVLDWTDYIDESGDFVPAWYYIYRGTTPTNIELHDSVDAKVASEWNDVNPAGAKYYKIAVKKEEACVTTGLLKVESGPFTLAMSNLAEAKIDAPPTNILSQNIYAHVYPNPSQGTIFLRIDSPDVCNAYITNIAGAKVWQTSQITPEKTIEVHNLSQGIYTLYLQCGDRNYSQKIIVQE